MKPELERAEADASEEVEAETRRSAKKDAERVTQRKPKEWEDGKEKEGAGRKKEGTGRERHEQWKLAARARK